ncbi:hypothetical protein INR49_016820 [Caranx melampygus]|nr:hypothetical protein INR49_016820 [Caranx melampygus]
MFYCGVRVEVTEVLRRWYTGNILKQSNQALMPRADSWRHLRDGERPASHSMCECCAAPSSRHHHIVVQSSWSACKCSCSCNVDTLCTSTLVVKAGRKDCALNYNHPTN